jgi:hypothetical protein
MPVFDGMEFGIEYKFAVESIYLRPIRRAYA